MDLLVVMDYEGSKLDKAVDIGVALGHVGVPLDIIVARPQDFAWRRDCVGTIEYPATHEGKVLYAQPDRVVEVLREWVFKAENDLKSAVHTLTLGEECPTGAVCFHAQSKESETVLAREAASDRQQRRDSLPRCPARVTG